MEIQDPATRKLAELKAYLEKKVFNHEEEIRTLKSFLDVIDSLLAERSYRRMEIPKTVAETMVKAQPNAPSQSLRTISGVHLADLYVRGSDLRIVTSEKISFNAGSAPLRSFLVPKVLEPMKAQDLEAVKKQELNPDNILSYQIVEDGTRLRQIEVQHFGNERRLNEIRNGVRWALRKMYEKTVGTNSG